MNIRIPLLALAAALLAAGAAEAEVVVVVAANSPVTAVTKDQAAQLFLNKSVKLPGGGAATPIDQASGPARGEFYAKVTGKDEAQLKAYWAQLTFTGKAQPPRKVSGDAAVKAALGENPAAIGYISDGAVDGSVKVVFKP